MYLGNVGIYWNLGFGSSSCYAKGMSERYGSEREIFDRFAKEGSSFHFGDMNYDDYQDGIYTSQPFHSRFQTSLMFAFAEGVIRIIYDLAVLIIFGTYNFVFVCDGGVEIKMQAFRVIRDVQETFGCICAIFNDCYGTYLVEMATYQRNCYDLADVASSGISYTNFIQSEFDKRGGALFHNVSKIDINGLDFDKLSNSTFRALFEKKSWDSESALEYLSEKNFKILLNSHPCLLSNLLSFVSNEKLNSLDFGQLSNRDIRDLFPISPNSLAKLETLSDDNFKLLLGRRDIPEDIYSIIPETKLNLIEYSTLSNKAFQKLFPADLPDTVKRRIATLSPENRSAVLSHAEASGPFWRDYVSDGEA